MSDNPAPKSKKRPPLWGPKSGDGPTLGACVRCSGISRLVQQIDPQSQGTQSCSECSLLEGTPSSKQQKA